MASGYVCGTARLIYRVAYPSLGKNIREGSGMTQCVRYLQAAGCKPQGLVAVSRSSSNNLSGATGMIG